MSEKIKQQLEKAFDSSGDSSTLVHLSQEEASAFIDTVVDQSSILKKVRVVKMDRAKQDVGKLVSNNRFLHAGGHDVALDDSKKDKFTPDKITLFTKEVIGAIEVFDDEIKHNITGQNLENRVLGLVSKKLANELEEIGMYSDTAPAVAWGASESAFGLTDGWLKGSLGESTFTVTIAAPGVITCTGHGLKAGDRIYVTTTGALPTGMSAFGVYYVSATGLTANAFQFSATVGGASITTTGTQSGTHTLSRGNIVDATNTGFFADAKVSKEKFIRLMKSLNTKFRRDTEIFTHNDIVIDFNQLFDSSFNRNTFIDNVMGTPLNSCPNFRFNSTGETEAIQTNPLNFLMGVQTEDASMSFEKERVASKRKTIYHFQMEVDFKVEEIQAVSVMRKLKQLI